MKKFLAIFLVLIMVASVALVSCKDETPSNNNNNDDDDVFVSQNGGNEGNNNGNENGNSNTPSSDWNTISYNIYTMTDLKIRSSTSTESDANLVATVTKGTSLTAIAVSTALDEIDKPEWYKISYNNQECYVVGAFVTTNIDDTVFERCATPEKLVIKNSGDSGSPYRVNLRRLPAIADSTLSNIVLTHETATENGELMKVAQSKSGLWFEVEYDNNKDGTPETYYIKMISSTRSYFVGLSNGTDTPGAQG